MERYYKEHITADGLLEEIQIGSITIYPIEGCNYIGIKSSCGYKNHSITDVYIYDNNNVLIKIIEINNSRTQYQIVNERTFSSPYNNISLKVFDGKYRVAYTDDRVCVISEEKPHKTISETKWKGIIDINNDIAIVNSRGNYYNLVRLNLKTNWSNELQGSKEIVYLNNFLYKFRNIETRLKYQLYNASLPRESNPKTLYDDIQPISEQMAVGIKTDVLWDFIIINSIKDGYLEVAYTSYKEPVFRGDTINLVELDDYGNEIPYTINIWGTNLSEEPEEEIKEPVVEVKEEIQPFIESEPVEEIPVTLDDTIRIGKLIVVSDNSVKKSERGDYLHITKSYKKACKCEGYPCWILLDQKVIAITEKKHLGQNIYALKIKNEATLPNEFEKFANISEDNKWLYFDDSVTAPETKILNEAINIITPKLRKLTSEREESIEIQQKKDVEDTKDILRFKAIYEFLKLQGYDKESIFDAAASLFPEIEAYIDYTDVKQNYYYGWKRYVENVEKLKRISPKGYIDEDKVIDELTFADKERTIFDYYTNVKEYPIEFAIECVQEESSTGGELRKEYETLMRLDDIVDNQRKMLQREIMNDLIQNFTVMADTSELLKMPGASNPITDNNEYVLNASKSTDFKIKEEKHIFKINESIKYDMFERKRFHYYEKPVYYLAYEKHIVILLNSEKARELDADNSRQFKIRGNGDDKKFDQDYSAINGTIANQRENNARIYVFECIDNETCRFFDEFQCIKSERIEDEKEERKIIYFTMKSLIRYNTEK